MSNTLPDGPREPEVTINEYRGAKAREVIDSFVEKLKGKYPDRRFPDIIEHIAYLATVNKESVGLVTGHTAKKEILGPKIFFGKAIVVDPQYQMGNVTSELVQSIMGKFKEIRIEPDPFAYDSPDASKVRAALIRAYIRMGFREHPHRPGMFVWHRRASTK